VVIRAETTQAISPLYTFAQVPNLVVTDGGRAIQPGPQVAMYPPPLLPAALDQAISPAGTQKLLDAARAAGLLTGTSDFTGGAPMPGGPVAQLTIVDGGKTSHLTGPATLDGACTAAQPACPMPKPGTPEAFAWYWGGLQDLGTWLGPELSAEARPYVGNGYRVLVGPPPQDAIPGNPVMVWPLTDTPLATYGTEYSLAGYRCGVSTGADAALLRPQFTRANTLTAWVDDPKQNATRSIVARQVLPGDGDPCALQP
jgi:hypothetical protein